MYFLIYWLTMVLQRNYFHFRGIFLAKTWNINGCGCCPILCQYINLFTIWRKKCSLKAPIKSTLLVILDICTAVRPMSCLLTSHASTLTSHHMTYLAEITSASRAHDVTSAFFLCPPTSHPLSSITGFPMEICGRGWGGF